MKYTLFVEGHPTTKGSLTWYGKGQVVNANERTKSWEQWIEWIWIQSPHYRTIKPKGPVKITLIFYFKRPKGHYGTGRNSDIIKPQYAHMTAPCVYKDDLDKLSRAVFDALTGQAYEDDGQIAELHARKEWTDKDHPVEGVEIIVEGEI